MQIIDEPTTVCPPKNEIIPAEEEPHQESALDQLAKNFETVGKYRPLDADLKVNDMIAFRVMTTDFRLSDYAIGMIEEIDGDVSSADCNFTIQIMGNFNLTEQKNFKISKMEFLISIFFLFLFVRLLTGGKDNVKHLSGNDDVADSSFSRIQINKIDIYDSKIVEL